MRKRIKLLFAIFVSLISFSVLSNAEEVTQKEAQLVAQKFIINKRTIQPQTLRKYAWKISLMYYWQVKTICKTNWLLYLTPLSS